MNNMKDKASAVLDKAIDILFISNPIGTGFGCLLGKSLHFLTKLFSPLLKKIDIMDFTVVNQFEWIIFGVVIMNVTTPFKRPKFDPSIEKAFVFIKVAKKNGKMSDFEVRQMYRNLSSKVLDKVTLEDSTAQKETLLKKILNDSNTNLGA